MSSDDQWILEWSHKTNNLHIQPLAKTLGINMSRFILGTQTPHDYVPLSIGTRDQMSAAADKLRLTLVAREAERASRREVSYE